MKHFEVFVVIFLLPLSLIAYKPQPGDLFFQDIRCGAMCDAIKESTYGYNEIPLSHIAMVVDDHDIIEAIGLDVHKISIKKFLARSLDSEKNPLVIVGRLGDGSLISQAIANSESWLGLAYNTDFDYKNNYQKFYCSQLIYDAFRLANNNSEFFGTINMTFKVSGEILEDWVRYFEMISRPIPEGKLGTNPAQISKSDKINIIYSYSNEMKIS